MRQVGLLIEAGIDFLEISGGTLENMTVCPCRRRCSTLQLETLN
jgi:hypothetical protein